MGVVMVMSHQSSVFFMVIQVILFSLMMGYTSRGLQMEVFAGLQTMPHV